MPVMGIFPARAPSGSFTHDHTWCQAAADAGLVPHAKPGHPLAGLPHIEPSMVR